MLFADHIRADASPKTNRESDFAFLDRSARVEMASIRSFVNSLLASYPTDDSAEVIARMRSGNDVQFRSACFELLIYGFLIRLGYKLRPHPELKNGSTSRPDFHVTSPDGAEFYLEAVLATENKDEDPAAQAMLGVTMDFLNALPHTNFWVGVHSEGDLTTQPSGKKIRAAVKNWLDSLDPDEVIDLINNQGHDAVPTFEWKHEDWKLVLRPIPISAERRGRAKQLIGMQSGSGGRIDSWSPVRNAIRHKGAKYGGLDLPLVVAVNFGSSFVDRIDEMQALYGQEQFVINAHEPEAEPRFQRVPNGAWNGRGGPQSRRVSGAWLFNDLSVFSVAGRQQTMYFNPWASIPLSDSLKCLPHALADHTGIVTWYVGLTLREVYELNPEWPLMPDDRPVGAV